MDKTGHSVMKYCKLNIAMVSILLAFLIVFPAGAAEYDVTGELGNGNSGGIVGLIKTASGGTGAFGLINHTLYNFDYKSPINCVYNSYAGLDVRFKFSVYGTGIETTTPKHSDGSYYQGFSKPVTFYIENVSKGTGRFSYQFTDTNSNGKPDAADYLLVAVNYNDDFIANTSGESGIQLIEMRDDSDPMWFRYGLHNLTSGGSSAYDYTEAQAITTMPILPLHTMLAYKGSTKLYYASGLKTPSSTYPNNQIWNYFRNNFRNTYNISRDGSDPETEISIHKTVDGVIYPSKVYIVNTTSGLPIWYETTITENDVTHSYFGSGSHQFGISIYDVSGTWWNKTFTIPLGSINATTDYSLELSNYTVVPGQTITATLESSTDPALSNIDLIKYIYVDSEGQTDILEYGSTAHKAYYSKISGTWYGWDTATKDFTVVAAGVPNPTQFSLATTGEKEVRCYLHTIYGDWIGLSKDVNVYGSAVDVPTKFTAIDYTDGSWVYGATISVKNKNTGTWLNQSATYGFVTLYSTNSTQFYACAEHWDYETACIDAYASNQYEADGIITNWQIILRPSATGGAGTTDVYTDVYDSDTNDPISGATVQFVFGANYTVKTTSGSGSAMYTSPSSTALIKITASKAGYKSASMTVQLAGESSKAYQFYLKKLSSETGTPTITPTPTKVPSDPRERALSVIDLISLYLELFANMAIIILAFTLFWMMVYAMTGGEVFNKLVRRGRR